jgi:hypothetical protein
MRIMFSDPLPLWVLHIVREENPSAELSRWMLGARALSAELAIELVQGHTAFFTNSANQGSGDVVSFRVEVNQLHDPLSGSPSVLFPREVFEYQVTVDHRIQGHGKIKVFRLAQKVKEMSGPT